MKAGINASTSAGTSTSTHTGSVQPDVFLKPVWHDFLPCGLFVVSYENPVIWFWDPRFGLQNRASHAPYDAACLRPIPIRNPQFQCGLQSSAICTGLQVQSCAHQPIQYPCHS